MADNKGKCFVIMPISDPDGYDKGHFESVYKDIFAPAIEKAGYTPHRVDEDASSGLIQAKIIENLIKAPMAICDLSTRNPNVLFELGIRQAYDKPVVLVQEAGTERIFDINGISCIDYDPSLIYRSVLDTQEKIANAIQETEKNPQYNSLVTALSISAAKYEQKSFATGELDAIMLRDIADKLDSLESRVERISQDPMKNFAYTPFQNAKANADKSNAEMLPIFDIDPVEKDKILNNYLDKMLRQYPNDDSMIRLKIRVLEKQLEDNSISLGVKMSIRDEIELLKKKLNQKE